MPTGTVDRQVTMGDRDWRVEVRISDTVNPWLRRADIRRFSRGDARCVARIAHRFHRTVLEFMRRPLGFTLLEMLVALAVFAVLGLMSSQMVSRVLDVHKYPIARGERLGNCNGRCS